VLRRRRALAAKVEALEELRQEIGEPGVGASDEALQPVFEKSMSAPGNSSSA
jgi:hypothetical protein